LQVHDEEGSNIDASTIAWPVHAAAQAAVIFVAALHLGFLYLEMFLWNTPRGRRIFGLTPALAEGSAKLAANQGLYNGFLAAGLLWGTFRPFAGDDAVRVQLFFLGCVIVAGIYGGLTTKRSILVMQALPGVVAAVLVWMAR
jgi:putative membrane protein